MKTARYLAAAAFPAAMMAALAQTPSTPSPAAPAQSAQPASQAQQPPTAVQQCVACHGARGEGNAAAGFPRIAGQSQRYLVRQLESYSNGTRRNAIMEPIAKALSAQDKDAAAAYYAQLDAPVPQRASNAPQPPERGNVLAIRGDNAIRVQACANCHGPGGVGEPPLYPYLAGLDANYLTAAINEWKNGTRTNDAGSQMATVAKALSPDDITAVAQYYASLGPPKPPPLVLLQAPTAAKPAATSPTVVTPQQAGPSPDKAVGTQQGAPTTGGTQGPGGGGESKNDTPGNSKGGKR
jgi:cytochrome c553